MSFLDKLRQKQQPKKPAILLYSEAGGGKTSLAAQFSKPVFLIDPKEDGIGDLKQAGLVDDDIPVLTCESWEQCHEYIGGLLNESHDRETLVFDAFSATGFEQLLFNYVGQTLFAGNMGEDGFWSFQKGPTKSLPALQALFAKLDRLREKMRIVVLAHSRVGKFNHPKHGEFSKIKLQLSEPVAECLMGWVSHAGFIDFAIETTTDKQTKKKYGKGGTDRELHFTKTATFDAKNRWGLTEPIDLGDSAREGFGNWMTAIRDAVAANKQTTDESN